MEVQEEFTVKVNHEAKLKELLRNLASVELQLCSDASKEIVKILKSDVGPEFLRAYVRSSSKLVEITQAWEFRSGKPGFLHILNLVAAILQHWKGDAVGDDGFGIARALDEFARWLIEEKMGDLYKELNGKEAKRQNAVLFLMASVVRRSLHLAWEVAKVFDFKLAVFTKLAEVRLRVKKVVEGRRKKYSTRKAFVAFAMAFLEVGNPRFLRGILQRKEMYLGVLRGLGNDDEDTVVYVLSVLRDRVLGLESLVPTGLRSVLFGSVTLKQLISISGRNDFGDAAELAHNVLVMACTDPVNGLMPDMERQPNPLHGNQKRLLGLMKNLKATEVASHKRLLLAIVKGRPSLGSEYLDEFPYNLDDLSSNNWFSAISLASDVVSAVTNGLSVGTVNKPPELDSQYVRDMLKCIGPRPFTRLVINKGLLHSHSLVKHGTLKLVLEVLKLMEFLMDMMDLSLQTNNRMMHKWEALKMEIQHGVRLVLPDPQVLLSLLSPLTSHFKSLESTKKRKAEMEIMLEAKQHKNVNKRLKTSSANEDLDILISGVDNPLDLDISGDGEAAESGRKQQLENGDPIVESIRDLWGSSQCSAMRGNLKDVDIFFYSKILDTLQIYYRTIPLAMEGLGDLFKFLPNNPLALPTILQQSLLKLLNEHVNKFSRDVTHNRSPPQMYKHLNQFVTLLICSPVREIKEHAYKLARAAMLSTGAFDNNTREICAWFFFIPGYSGNCVCFTEEEVEIIEKLSSVVVTVLCDAVSTTGNNLYRYMELLKHYIYGSQCGKDIYLEVGPFVLCILEKCLRLLSAESGSFTIPQKSLISLYICNSIKYIMETQVDAGPLSYLIDRVLSEKLENCGHNIDAVELSGCPCEWRPLKALLHFARQILHKQYYSYYSKVEEVLQSNNSFADTLHNIAGVVRTEIDIGLVGLTLGFSFSLMCTTPTEILKHFPLVLSISSNLHEVPFSVLSSIFFRESTHLTDVSKLWPEMIFSALDSVLHGKEKKEEIFYEGDHESKESAACAFACYLRRAPFHVLFSSIVQSSNLHLFEKSGLLKLLFEKLSEMPYDHLVSSLCNVLFWINHTKLCYRVRSLDELRMVSELCFELLEHLLKRVLVEYMNTVSPAFRKAPPLHYVVEVVEVIFHHPAVVALLDCPLSGNEEFSDSIFGESMEKLLESAKQTVLIIDHGVLNLITMVSEYVFTICDNEICNQVIDCRNRISRIFEVMEKKLSLAFKNKFDACIQSMDFKPLLPTFYVLCTLVRWISPCELLDLVNWLFSRIDFDGTTLSSERKAQFVVLHLASSCFDSLSAHMDHPLGGSKNGCLGGMNESHFDIIMFENIFFQVLRFGIQFKHDISDTCLLKAVKVVNVPHLFSAMALSRVMASTPVNIISYCLHRINRTSAELLYLIASMSPFHTSVFGSMFSEIADKLPLPNSSETKESSDYSFSEEELVMILPTVALYLNSVSSKFRGQPCKYLERIILAYGQVLLGGFCEWKTFVFRSIFEIGVEGPLISTTEDFLNLFSDSLLGKAILMVQDHLALSEEMLKPKCRSNLFKLVCPSGTDDIFDLNVSETSFHLLKQPLDFVNRVVAKTKLCRILLFPDCHKSHSQREDGEIEAIPSRVSSWIEKSRVRFLRMLINSWIVIVKKFSKYLDHSGDMDGQNLSLDRFLEVFVINNILELAMEMHDCLIKLDSLPFIELLFKSFLLYRFGDPLTIKMLRIVLTSLSDGKFSCASVIQLLLAHSQFAQTIQSACQSLVSTHLGLVLTPMSSILKSLVIPQTDLVISDCKSNTLTSPQHLNSLELVKLVRVLFHIYAQQNKVNSEDDTDIHSRELVYLLLSAYGATCTEIDLEIYNLLIEIESNDKSCAGIIDQMDHLWGIASLNVRNEWKREKQTQSADPKNMKALEERRKMLFRENIPVDPKLCAQTVLYFPCNRFMNGGILNTFHKDSSMVIHGASSATSKLQVYDPFFILRFSFHCLSMGYIEPIEFASVGLLAVTFVSISSPDDGLRKLGYNTLGKFKSILEQCQKKKEMSRLRLLLSYVQNGIEEPWKRIPSIIAVFAAEASLVLLDPLHDNYPTISKHLMSSSKVNMKAVPLFQPLFWSSSKSFGADRLWMLRLLYVGLNSEDDAKIYIKNSIFQNLLSYYSSPLSDDDSKGFIIQMVKKAVQFRKAVWFLVEHCGLIPWLSFIVSSLCGNKYQDRRKFTLSQLSIILEVVNYITTPRSIFEWLQKNAMEQLSELSSHLYKLLVDDIVLLIEEKIILCNSILQILTSVLKISQKRKVYQPHFTLSEEGLFQLYEAVEATRCSTSMVLGLKAVLMSTPPVTLLQMDQEKLSKFLRWAVATAIQSTSSKTIRPEDSADCPRKNPPEESLVSKLLRWLTASVILGKISQKLCRINNDGFLERLNLDTLLSLLRCSDTGSGENAGYSCEDVLSASILYLLQKLEFNHRLLPSAVSALCLLLPVSFSEAASVAISSQALCSKIRCPAEANLAWRWSYYQAWRDLSLSMEADDLDEIHSCERLLILASNALQKRSGCNHCFELEDDDVAELILRVSHWERALIHSSN